MKQMYSNFHFVIPFPYIYYDDIPYPPVTHIDNPHVRLDTTGWAIALLYLLSLFLQNISTSGLLVTKEVYSLVLEEMEYIY